MSSTEDTQQKVSDATLPYSTDNEDILRLIEAIKKKPDNEKAIREIYNKSNFETSRKALEVIGILDSQLSFSKAGKELAIEREDGCRRELFLKFFLKYPPYGHFLESVSHGGDLSITETETIKDYWWKHNYGSSGNNREDGVVAFGKLLQLTGLGKFVTGRRGKPSRIEWNPGAKALIDTTCAFDDSNSVLEEQLTTASGQEDVVNVLPILNEDLANIESFVVNSNPYAEQTSLPSGASPSTTLNFIPNISINVDMSEWDNSKIIAFFKAAYGIFDNDREKDLSTTCSQSVSESSDGYSDP